MKMLLSSPGTTTGKLLLKVRSYAIGRIQIPLVWMRIDPLHESGDRFRPTWCAIGHTKKLTWTRLVVCLQHPIDPNGKAVAEVGCGCVVWIRRGSLAEVHQVACRSNEEIVFGDRSPCVYWKYRASYQSKYACGDNICLDAPFWPHLPLPFALSLNNKPFRYHRTWRRTRICSFG
jgi:hypothetical protein